MRRVAMSTLVPLTVSLLGTASSATAGDACQDPTDAAYSGYDCKVERLRERSFVVVAVPDTGINPYHEDFRLPADDDLQGVPPWEYIDGYPKTAKPIPVSLDAPYYDAAVAQDQETWEAVEQESLYYFPGTKIIGGYSVSGVNGSTTNPPILDANGHGTATASLVAGNAHGFSRDADILIVVAQGWTLEWVFDQPWIDVISNSWGYAANVSGFGNPEKARSKAATDAGKVVAFASGNGVSGTGLPCDPAVTTTSHTSGPPWNLVVGAVSPKNQQAHCWHSIPPDVSSYGSFVPAAERDSFDGERNFAGTSASTPLVAGVVADQILEARREFGDALEGPHGSKALALAPEGNALPSSGPLDDGVLLRTEVEATTMKTADPAPFDPAYCAGDPLTCGNTTPTTPAYFVYEGYGIVNQASASEAMDVLFGRAPMPSRPDVDTWMAQRDAVSGTFWSVVP